MTMSKFGPLRAFARVALSLTLLAPAVHADPEQSTADASDTANECVTGFEQSQVLRQSGKLRAARKELLKCAQIHCKQALQVPCTRWLEEVEGSTPTVIVEATINGEDRTDVRVEMDGEVLAEQLSGKALEVDPGPHEFRFSHPDFPPIDKKVVMREGEKRRIVQVSFGTPVEPPKQVGSPPNQSTPPAPPLEMHRPVPVATYVLAGAAVVGIGAFVLLGATAQDRERQLERTCSPNCSDSDVESLQTRYLIANITLGAGIAAGIGAIVTYVVRPEVPKEGSTLSATIEVSPQHALGIARVRF